MTSSPVRAPYFAAVSCLLACSGDALDVGSDQPPGGSAGSGGSSATMDPPPPGPPLPEWPDTAGCEPDSSTAIGGTWKGYVQGQQPPDGNLEITLGMNGDELCGTVTFGEAEPPPAASDPEKPYPPGVDYGFHPPDFPYVGFPYTITTGTLSGARLYFRFDAYEILRGWCQLQTPYYWPEVGMYSCVPSREGRMSDDGTCYAGLHDPVEVSCAQLGLCGYHACACNETGCEAALGVAYHVFDLHVDGDSAEGTMVGEGETVYLDRVE